MGRWAGNMGSKELLEFPCRVTPGLHGTCSPCGSSGRSPGREPENPFLTTQTRKEAPQAVEHSAAVLGGLHCVHWKYTISANQMAFWTSQQGSSLHGLQCPSVLIQGLWDVACPHDQVMSNGGEQWPGPWGLGQADTLKLFNHFAKCKRKPITH